MTIQNPDHVPKEPAPSPSPAIAVNEQGRVSPAQAPPSAEPRDHKVAPQPPVSSPEDTKSDTKAQSKTEVTARDVINSSLQTIEHQTQITQTVEIERVLIGNVTAPTRSFSIDMMSSVDDRVESPLSYLMVSDEKPLTDAVGSLARSRLALVVGPSDNGKGVMAGLIAQMLRRQDETLFPTRTVDPPLPFQVNIDLQRLTRNSDHFGGRVTIFRDVLSRRNGDLVDFFTGINHNVVRNLRAQLENINGYLLFTSDADLLPPQCLKSILPECLIAVHPPSEAALKAGLERTLAAYAQIHNVSESELNGKLSFAMRERAVALSRTMVRIVRFVELYLADVLEEKVSIEEAFDRLDTASPWFQNELSDDLPAWVFAFTLVLLQATQAGDGVRWQEFYVFHENVRRHIWKWLQPQGVRDRRPETKPRVLSDRLLLDRSRAYVARDQVEKCDVIRFQDPSSVSSLWDSLLTENRSLLCGLVPLLQEIAQTDDSPSIRGRAAQALGRIGEIAPLEITRKSALIWSQETPFSTRSLVGYLCQGVRASRNQSYRDASTEILESLAADRKGLWTALAAYKQIGTSELTYAMERLRQLAEKYLAEPLENAQLVEEKLLVHLRAALASAPREELDLVSRYYKALFALFQEVFAEDRENAISLQYALVSLCVTNGPIPVYRELRKWLSGKPGLKALVSIIFLQEKGIAAELARRPEQIDVNKNGRTAKVSTDPSVVAMASGSGSVRTVGNFLEDVFVAYHTFFVSQTWRYLHDMYFNHLKAWAKSGMQSPEGRAAIEQLFVQLLQTMYRPLNEQMLYWLQSDADFVTGDLRPIREAVIGGSLKRNSPSNILASKLG